MPEIKSYLLGSKRFKCVQINSQGFDRNTSSYLCVRKQMINAKYNYWVER